MVEQRVDHRPVEIARGGMDDHARGLVDDDQMFVLIGDDQAHVLRDIVRRFGGGDADFERRREGRFGRRVAQDCAARVADAAILDQALDPLARQVGQSFGQRPVQPQSSRAIVERHGQNIVIPLH